MLYPRGGDTHVWIRASASPIHEKNGSIAGAVLAILDIDELKREKEKLLERIAELEQQLRDTL
jgi:hypothetical protein